MFSKNNYMISFLVTSNEDSRIFDLINSFKSMKNNRLAELIIVFDHLTVNFTDSLSACTKDITNISYSIVGDYSRCKRKDIAVSLANTNYVCFIDSDCTIDKDYLIELSKVTLSKYEVMRGTVVYEKKNNIIGKFNSFYRNTCDLKLYKEEAFTPNLIINKSLIKKIGGWSKHNIDESDDHILSYELKKYNKHLTPKILENCKVNHVEDNNILKLSKTWFTYGYGHSYIYLMQLKDTKKNNLIFFKKNIPPFAYERKYGLLYYIFCLYQYIFIFLGYLFGIRLLKRRYSLGDSYTTG